MLSTPKVIYTGIAGTTSTIGAQIISQTFPPQVGSSAYDFQGVLFDRKNFDKQILAAYTFFKKTPSYVRSQGNITFPKNEVNEIVSQASEKYLHSLSIKNRLFLPSRSEILEKIADLAANILVEKERNNSEVKLDLQKISYQKYQDLKNMILIDEKKNYDLYKQILHFPNIEPTSDKDVIISGGVGFKSESAVDIIPHKTLEAYKKNVLKEWQYFSDAFEKIHHGFNYHLGQSLIKGETVKEAAKTVLEGISQDRKIYEEIFMKPLKDSLITHNYEKPSPLSIMDEKAILKGIDTIRMHLNIHGIYDIAVLKRYTDLVNKSLIDAHNFKPISYRPNEHPYAIVSKIIVESEYVREHPQLVASNSYEHNTQLEVAHTKINTRTI